MSIYNEGDDLISLWYSPYAQQWSKMGFQYHTDVEREFGAAFRDYHEGDAQRLVDRSNMRKEHIQDNIDNFATKGQMEELMRANIAQFKSNQNVQQVADNMKYAKEQQNIARNMEVSKSLLELDKISKQGSETGLRSGSMNMVKENAVNNIVARVDAANASSKFKRKESKSQIDRIKRDTGYFAEDDAGGGWVEGRDEQLAIDAHAREASMQELKTDIAKGSLERELLQNQKTLYDNWVLGSLDTLTTIFSLNPEI